MIPPEHFKTERLILRKPGISDAVKIYDAYAGDPDIPYYMTWKPHKDVSETESFIKECLSNWESKESFSYVITLTADTDKPFAMIDTWPRGQHQMWFGYVSARDYWGKGYMTEALTCLIDWALNQDNIWRAAAYCDVQNFASARVMEKAGMSLEGICKKYGMHPNISDIPRDCRIYAKVKQSH